jgi:hypothetical protein
VRAPARFCPKCRSSAIAPVVYEPFAREESGMVNCAIHNSFASHVRSRSAPDADHDRRDAQPADLVVAMVQAAARPRPAHSSRRPVGPAAPRPMASGTHLCHPGAVGNGNSAPMPDANAATTTSRELLLRSARQSRPTARTADEFRHNLNEPEIAAGFEGCQTACRPGLWRPLFWHHRAAGFCPNDC